MFDDTFIELRNWILFQLTSSIISSCIVYR